MRTRGQGVGSEQFVELELGNKRSFALEPKDLNLLMDDKKPDSLAKLGGASGLASRLHTSLSDGLNDDDAEHRQRVAVFGSNVIPDPPSTTIWELIWEQLHDPTLVILIAAACVSLPVGVLFEDPKTGWIEGTAILVSVCIVVMVASVNDYQKEKQFRDLNRKKNDIPIKVMRAGKRQNISINDLVVGDVVVLETGDAIPCDGILFHSAGLKVNESALTGESDEVAKSPDRDPFCIASTQISDGMGTMVAIAVGTNSVKGRITGLMMGDDESEETLLQKKLTFIAEQIGKFGFAVATFTVLVLVVGYLIKDKIVDDHDMAYEDIAKILDFVITGLTIVVVAVPEGLPLAVTISMAFSVKKMLNDNNLVRHLNACEVMGGATTICSDKTGTLTRNKMTVVQAAIGQSKFRRGGARPIADGIKDLGERVTKPLVDAIIYNSTALIAFDNPKEPKVRQDTGNKTECALLELALEMGFSKSNFIDSNFEYAAMHTFSSARKRMSCAVKKPDGTFRILVKGASEVVLDLCTSIMTANGEVRPITESDRNECLATISQYAGDALRTLCIAYRDVPASRPPANMTMEEMESNLVCIAIVGIEDPVRDEVPDAVRKCHAAGIVVRMVTGDNLQTAKAIATQCKILSGRPGELVMEGPTFRATVLKDPLDPHSIDMKKFRDLVPRLRVLARSSPADKFVLVRGLRELGEVVAVTGDGTNDGPALRQADVGLSMGIQGTEVAKEASDIILMDDNFNSIVSAVKWGRNVFDSISKFVQFQLTVNIVAIITAVVGAFTIQESPLTAVQMLWVNLIMDTLASLALATEAPHESLLTRPPYRSNRAIISTAMWRNILGQAAYQLVVIMLLIFDGHRLFSLGENGAHKGKPTPHFTMVFNTFVMLQLFNEINCRKIHNEINVFAGFFNNIYFTSIIFGTLVVQFLIVQFGGLPMSTVPLSLNEWLICLGLGLGSLVVGVFIHLVPLKPEATSRSRVMDGEASAQSQSFFLRGNRRRTQSIASVSRLSRKSTTGGNANDERQIRNIVQAVV